jgi:hypothetical protein
MAGEFLPDLVVHDQNGQVHFIELERKANKDHEQGYAKWHNFFQASGRRMYVVCGNPPACIAFAVRLITSWAV